MAISGKTKVCGVIGDPIEHTLSPIMQNAAFDFLKIEYVFLAFKVQITEVEKAMDGMRALNIHGLNVTMPHKNAVVKYLDQIDPTAKTIASVNTILNKNGKLEAKTRSTVFPQATEWRKEFTKEIPQP